jgi:hypothetical protein
MSYGVQDLVGTWESEMGDQATKMRTGRVRLEFYPDQTLAYVILEEGKTQIIKLTYDVVGDRIVTDQPSHPSVNETRFELASGLLKLFYDDDEPVAFRKVS